ncbi:VOC family protein [Dickeya fangzhongdai]|uniref:VOC family protein n=1 Tax=Dickeya fangzhongdai TaxID=1778540 RepID=UPI0023E3A039|nr:glyoxalase [Dickeya fangzhongdai]WES91224.1 glyoxalase [Dickeya fangzhongdai]
MNNPIPGVDVLFVAGFGPVTVSAPASQTFYQTMLNLPLKPMEGNDIYLSCDELGGVKNFALWPLAQASQSCFGSDDWPSAYPRPQGWMELEVADIAAATEAVKQQGYPLLVENRLEPWGQTVTRFLSPEGLLLGMTHTPWLRE